MAATVPVRVTLPVPLPVIPPEAKPLVTLSSTVILPLATAMVTVTLVEPASTSAMLRPVTDRLVSSFTVWAVGTVLAGASLTANTVIATAVVSVKAPPVPVAPPSLVVTVRVSLPLKLALPT